MPYTGSTLAHLDWLTAPRELQGSIAEHMHAQIWRAGGLVLDQLGPVVDEEVKNIPDLQLVGPAFPKAAGLLIARSRSSEPIIVGNVPVTWDDLIDATTDLSYQLTEQMGADYFVEQTIRKPRYLGPKKVARVYLAPKISTNNIKDMRITWGVDINDEYGDEGYIPPDEQLMPTFARIPKTLTDEPGMRRWQLVHQARFANALNLLAKGAGINIGDLMENSSSS